MSGYPVRSDESRIVSTWRTRRPWLTSRMSLPRTGIGVDVHAYADDDRTLSLACLTWPGERGIEGHSDGDVVSHAVVDAVRPLGINDIEMPCTPQRVWRAIQGGAR